MLVDSTFTQILYSNSPAFEVFHSKLHNVDRLSYMQSAFVILLKTISTSKGDNIIHVHLYVHTQVENLPIFKTGVRLPPNSNHWHRHLMKKKHPELQP